MGRAGPAPIPADGSIDPINSSLRLCFLQRVYLLVTYRQYSTIFLRDTSQMARICTHNVCASHLNYSSADNQGLLLAVYTDAASFFPAALCCNLIDAETISQ